MLVADGFISGAEVPRRSRRRDIKGPVTREMATVRAGREVDRVYLRGHRRQDGCRASGTDRFAFCAPSRRPNVRCGTSTHDRTGAVGLMVRVVGSEMRLRCAVGSW